MHSINVKYQKETNTVKLYQQTYLKDKQYEATKQEDNNVNHIMKQRL